MVSHKKRSDARQYVFVSFSRTDKEKADAIARDLRAANIPVWIDRTDLSPGTPDWEAAIRGAVNRSFAVVLLASVDSRKSLFVRGELKLAKSIGCKVFPVWISGTQWEDCIPLGMTHTQYIDLRGTNWKEGLSKLVGALLETIGNTGSSHHSTKSIEGSRPREFPLNSSTRSEYPRDLTRFWKCPNRRKLLLAGIAYMSMAWLAIQVAVASFPALLIPNWALKLAFLMLILGFPVTLVVTWVLEWIPLRRITTPDSQTERSDPSTVRKRSGDNWFFLLFAAGMPFLIFGSLIVLFFFLSGIRDASSFVADDVVDVATETEAEKSIAVLPFENLSPDPENAFFAAGVQEDILTNLSKIGNLDKVISRSSTLKFSDPDRNLRIVGEELGVHYVVEGSVRRAGNLVRVTVQLINVNTDDHIWAENFDRELTEIFAIQSAVAKEIAHKLRAIISPEELMEVEWRPTENIFAYDFFVKARDLIQRSGRSGYKKISLLENAVSLDPQFAEAWAALANETIYWWDVSKNRNDPVLYERAHNALVEAQRFDSGLPDIPIAQSTFAYRRDLDLDGSINYLLEALSVNPNNPRAQLLIGRRYFSLGRMEEAQHYLELSLRSDPLTPATNNWLCSVYQVGGLWDQAFSLIQKNLNLGISNKAWWQMRSAFTENLKTGNNQRLVAAIESVEGYRESSKMQAICALINRDLERATWLIGDAGGIIALGGQFGPTSFKIVRRELLTALIWFHLGRKDMWMIEVEKVRTTLKKTIEKNPDTEPLNYAQLAICYALTGEAQRMESAVSKARELAAHPFWKFNDQVQCELLHAMAYLAFGDENKALETLEAASKMDSLISLKSELALWFIFDRLKGNPRFDGLVHN